MHGLNRKCGRLLIRNAMRGKSTEAALENVNETNAEVEKAKHASASTVYRPPYYRKPHQHHEAKHMLQEEFPNSGDASGAGVRLFDYYKTAELVNSMPTIKEKIDLVSPYERPWTRAEKTWRRDWHPTLMATRKAWAVPSTPAYFDVLDFYKYLTKTRVERKSLDSIYHGLKPPTADFEKSYTNTMKSLEFETEVDCDEEKLQKLLGSLIDDAMGGIAHNIPRLSGNRVAYDVESEAFWIRSGFDFLYDVEEVGTRDNKRKLHNYPKYIGDDRRKLGELAFVHRDKLAVQIRSREPISSLHSLESQDAQKTIFEGTNSLTEQLFPPKVYNLWPDQQPLWQCPGYHADSGETHTHGVLAVKSIGSLRNRIAYWMGYDKDSDLAFTSQEALHMLNCGAEAQAIVSLFTTLCAQAHTHGFTQYTDITRPFTSQLILSDGNTFYFAVGQLNTLAINIDCEGFVNPRTNYMRIEGPFRLFNSFDREHFDYLETKETDDMVQGCVKSGLNPIVLERITQMLMKQ